jgi:hypothetical protein
LKKVGVGLLMGAALALALASPAMADQIQVGFLGSPFGPYQAGSGGEFTLNDVNGNPADSWLNLSGYVAGTTSNFGSITSFQTFCIEETEFISGYSIYNAQLNANAMFGSVGSPIGDPVSAGTGWLYSQFAKGVLGSYAYSGTTANRKASADLLQKAIWWLEGEPGVAFNAGNVYMAAVVAQFGNSQSAAQANGGATYGVYAVNLWTGIDPNQNRAQDQLYYRDPGIATTAVPDGGTTLALLGMALCGMAILSRRFQRA